MADVHATLLLKWLGATKHEAELDEKGNSLVNPTKAEVIRPGYKFDVDGETFEVRSITNSNNGFVATTGKRFPTNYVRKNLLM